MKNPINVFDTIRDSFILYVKTAFRTKHPLFEKEREELLKRDKIFARAPWVEPLPEYLPSDFSINEITSLPNLNNEELEIFNGNKVTALIEFNKCNLEGLNLMDILFEEDSRELEVKGFIITYSELPQDVCKELYKQIEILPESTSCIVYGGVELTKVDSVIEIFVLQ